MGGEGGQKYMLTLTQYGAKAQDSLNLNLCIQEKKHCYKIISSSCLFSQEKFSLNT